MKKDARQRSSLFLRKRLLFGQASLFIFSRSLYFTALVKLSFPQSIDHLFKSCSCHITVSFRSWKCLYTLRSLFNELACLRIFITGKQATLFKRDLRVPNAGFTWVNQTLATTGKGLLDAGNVIFKATFLLRKIVALVAILWFTGWLQETICFVLHYLLLTIRMIPFHQSSRGEILYTRNPASRASKCGRSEVWA